MPLLNSLWKNNSPLYESTSLFMGENIQETHSPLSKTLTDIPNYQRTKNISKSADLHVKIVVVGDGAIGKTCLLISYTQRKFPEDYIPTVFENYVTKIDGPKGEVIELALWDTAGQEEYSRLRPLSYTDVDILLVCYSIDNWTSLNNVQELWIPEVKHFCPNTPIILVGLKSDLYALDDLDSLVDPKDADSLAQSLGAFMHLQCSSKSRHNIEEIFNIAITTSLYEDIYNYKKNHRFKTIFKKIPPYKKNIRRHKCIIL